MAKSVLKNEEIALLQYFQKYDNRTCSKSIASLGTCACNHLLLKDRTDDFGVNVDDSFPGTFLKAAKVMTYLSAEICSCQIKTEQVIHKS